MGYVTPTTGQVLTAGYLQSELRDQVVVPWATAAARDAAVSAPVVGMVHYLRTNDAAEGLTTRNSANQWRRPWNLPWGVVAVATRTTSQSVTSITPVDVTSLTVTWTAVANRQYRVRASGLVQQQTSGADAQCYLSDGGGAVITQHRFSLGANAFGWMNPEVLETPAAGSVTRKVQAATPAGTLLIDAAALRPWAIWVEDIGPSGAPA